MTIGTFLQKNLKWGNESVESKIDCFPYFFAQKRSWIYDNFVLEVAFQVILSATKVWKETWYEIILLKCTI